METMTERDADVLVVGACTAGLYFAGLMARQGYRVIVCDRAAEGDLGNEYDIIHIGREHFARFGLHEPAPGDAEYVAAFDVGILRSALNRYPKKSRASVLVLRRAGLIRRLAAWAKEAGAELVDGASFEKPLFAGPDGSGLSGDSAGKGLARLAGAVFRKAGGGELRVRARLCADASGIPAVLRTSLPPDYGVETFVTGPRDQFYVVLHYANLKNPERDRVELNTTWVHYKTWLAPQHEKGGAIMGVGANLSFDYAERCFRRFAARGYLPEYTLDHIEQGSTPYRRPPYRFTAGGFIALGSAACISNPWSGEGVPYGWLLDSIAAEEAGRAMKDGGDPSPERLWKINVRYAEEQGALFAKNLAMLCGATRCTEEENDYEFRHGIIFEDDDEKGRGCLPLKLLGALLSGGLSPAVLGRLLSAAAIGEKIFRHYRSYPQSPGGLEPWARKADRLWAKAGSMADLAEQDLAAMP
jgi:flavin-dependent dehydrogenase